MNNLTNTKGEFVKKDSTFRDWVKADGSSKFPPEAGRYHLYVSLACPWAARALFARKMKGLEDVISMDVVDHFLGDKGWSFDATKNGCTPDTVNGKETLRQIYQIAEEGFDGRCTVPVLWDKKTNTIVNNESAELLRMINAEFNDLCKTEAQKKIDLYPEALRAQIDELNDWIYPSVNHGVYKAGFATKQEAYDEAVKKVFEGLDRLEGILSKSRYLLGNDVFTEADVRLFTTLIRFDPVYVGHFKCNKKRIVDYPNIWAYTREIYQMPGIRDTVNQEHIQKHYQMSHPHVNPTRIVATGPEINYDEPHGRDKQFN